jgi:hypothetical protein
MCCQYLRYLNGFRVLNSTFIQDSSRGVLLRIESPGGIIQNNFFLGNDTFARGSVHINPNDDTHVAADRIRISNNTFSHGMNQLVLAGASNCTIAGNLFEYSTNLLGVSLILTVYDATWRNWNCQYNEITNNTFINVRNGIKMSGNSTLGAGSIHNSLTDNVFYSGPDVKGYIGIQEAPYADYNEIVHNGFSGVWSDIDPIPEFSTLAMPIISTLIIVMFRRRQFQVARMRKE